MIGFGFVLTHPLSARCVTTAEGTAVKQKADGTKEGRQASGEKEKREKNDGFIETCLMQL